MDFLETGYVRLPSGLRLFYRRIGTDGPTVLLLHGWPQTGHAWRHVLPTLAASGYAAVAPDLRGCGESDKPTGGYDAVTRMEDVRALVSALGLNDQPLFVVGHGDGGTSVAQTYALEHPEEVAGLAVIGAGPVGLDFSRHWSQAFHQTPDLPELLIGSNLDAYLRYFFHGWSHDPRTFSEEDIAVYVRCLQTPGALRASLAPFRELAADEDHFRRELKQRYGMPVLALVGESDPRVDLGPLSTPHAVWKHAAKYLRVEVIPRGGYWLPEERPDPIAAALLTFFAEIRDGRDVFSEGGG